MDPNAPASDAQRRKLGALGDHEAANDRNLTMAEASRLIDLLVASEKGKPAVASEKPAGRVETPRDLATPAPGECVVDRAEPWVQIAVWVPVSRVEEITEAVKRARAPKPA